jgi:hypothetical protein
VRELLEFARVRLAPARVLGQPDSATLDHINVGQKSRGLRAAIRRDEMKVERAEMPPQIFKKSLTVAKPFDQNGSGLTIGLASGRSSSPFFGATCACPDRNPDPVAR